MLGLTLNESGVSQESDPGSLNSQQVSSDQLQVTSYNPNESLPPLVDRLIINQCVCCSVDMKNYRFVNVKYSQPF